MSTIWEDKIIVVNELRTDNQELLGTAIVSKDQKYFYDKDTDVERLIAKAKHIISFDGFKYYNNYNFRALYYQIKPAVKFQNIADIVKQEYFTIDVSDTIYFSKADKAKQAVIEAVFMLQFFLKNYKKRNKSLYRLDAKLISKCKEYHPEIKINQTQLRTELSLAQKQQWDTERILFNTIGFPVASYYRFEDKNLQKRVDNYFEKIKGYKQKYDDLIEYLEQDSISLDFDVTSTATGRILCRSKEVGLFTPDKGYRELFVADKGKIFVSADYKKQEACILAEVSGDEQLKHDLHDEDFYSRLARWAIRRTEKSIGKLLFYALVYGANAKTLAGELDIEEWQAKEVMRKIKSRYGNLAFWVSTFKEKTNYFGRSLHTNTVNAYVQSTAADILKDRLLATFHFNPVLVLSDNIIYQILDVDVKRTLDIIKLLLEKTTPFDLEVDLKTNYNLLFK